MDGLLFSDGDGMVNELRVMRSRMIGRTEGTHDAR
jgi:hypothetical protein